jgi:hypothetical protein
MNLDSSPSPTQEDTSDTDEPEETSKTDASAETEFTVDCPFWPKSKKYIARAKKEDLWIESDVPPGAPELKVHYAVKPGSRWLELREYRRARCEFGCHCRQSCLTSVTQ